MKILVTGGAGFIGSHLCEQLLDSGHSVIVIDNLSTGSLANIEHLKGHKNFAFTEGDILDCALLDKMFKGVDMVYHLAAAVGVKFIIDNPLDSIHVNVLGTENVFRCAVKRGCKVVLASTSEVYGKNDLPRLSENSDRILGATSITRWSYASSKALDEFISFGYHKHHKLPIVIGRLFNTCGPRQSSRYGMVIPRFISQALKGDPITVYGTGEQTRAFTFVKDTVKALIGIGFSDKCVGEVFNIGNEAYATTIKNLAALVKAKARSSSEIKFITYEEAYERDFEDMMHRVPDTTKLRSFIDFKPDYSLDQILDHTIAFMKGKNG
ncbi:MAG: GDP-mannose 4,6-dehydratase [Candidatus Omnitrophica bacterium]|nr:GDP-mannose 4,6-dehydratase [Candidatus Omnitrophota bacterium]